MGGRSQEPRFAGRGGDRRENSEARAGEVGRRRRGRRVGRLLPVKYGSSCGEASVRAGGCRTEGGRGAEVRRRNRDGLVLVVGPSSPLGSGSIRLEALLVCALRGFYFFFVTR